VALARLKIDQGSADRAVPLLVPMVGQRGENKKRSAERVQVEGNIGRCLFRRSPNSKRRQEGLFPIGRSRPVEPARGFLMGAAICAAPFLATGKHYESRVRPKTK